MALKADRMDTLRQRLKRGRFEFGALLEGVSTLDEVSEKSTRRESDTAKKAAKLPDQSIAVTADTLELITAIDKVDVVEITDVEVDVLDQFGADDSSTLQLNIEIVQDYAQQTIQHPPLRKAKKAEVPNRLHDPDANQEERLRWGLETLSNRLAEQVSQFRSAAAALDVEESAFLLAHMNQILELIHSIDPSGDLARQFALPLAPPQNRVWPATCWTVAELAESPISGLIPAHADDVFLHEMIYAAWGLTFEKPS